MKSKILKKILLLGLPMVVLFTTVVAPAWARDPMAGGEVTDYYGQVFTPAVKSQDVNLQSTVYEIFLSLLSSMNASMYKCDDDACQAAIRQPRNAPPPLGADKGISQPMAEARPTGLIPWLMNTNVAFLTKPAISSVDYMAYVGGKLHLTNPVYAQGNTGFGYEGLAPAREIWTAFRNIAYLIATIGFVVLSFMIMFRLKLSAQTVIGAQQAITKLIVVFLAVTFSYAIAGLIVDLIFIFSFLIITLFVGTGLIGPDPQTVQTTLFRGNIIRTIGALWGTAGKESGEIISKLTIDLFGISGFNDQLDALIEKLFNWSVGNIAQAIIGVAIIFALFKLLFALLFAYLEILILTILAPIMLLPDIMPGGKAFAGWAKRLFANAMVFPTTTFMLLLGIVITGGSEDYGVQGNISPAFNTGLKLPFLSVGAGNLQPLLGIGVILLTYKVVDMVKNALKVQAFQYTTAIGAALGAGAGMAMAAPGQIGGLRQAPSRMMAGLGSIPYLGEGIRQKQAILQAREKAYQQAIIKDAMGTAPTKSKKKARHTAAKAGRPGFWGRQFGGGS